MFGKGRLGAERRLAPLMPQGKQSATPTRAGSSHLDITPTPTPCDSLSFSLLLSQKLLGRITHSSCHINELSLESAAEGSVPGAE